MAGTLTTVTAIGSDVYLTPGVY